MPLKASTLRSRKSKRIEFHDVEVCQDQDSMLRINHFLHKNINAFLHDMIVGQKNIEKVAKFLQPKATIMNPVVIEFDLLPIKKSLEISCAKINDGYCTIGRELQLFS